MDEPAFLEPPARMSADGLPVRETSLELLNLDQVAAHIAQAQARGRYQGPQDVHHYLASRTCTVTVGTTTYLTLTGLLCFGTDPQAVFPNAVVDLGHYHGQEAIAHEVLHLEKGIGGTIFDQLERVDAYLWQNTHHGMTLDAQLQRVEVHQYPRAVTREIGTNMLAHRDYAIYASVSRVHLFRDRMEWISPGSLPPGLTVANILHEQRPRNPNIMRILYEAGYVEAFGQGLDTVVAVLAREGMRTPAFEDTGASFRVVVYGRADTVGQTTSRFADLTETQQLIMELLIARGEARPREIYALFPDRAERSIQNDLRVLRDRGLVLTRGGSRALRYRPAAAPAS